MSKDQILGVARHVLTIGGGILVAKGYGDAAGVETISGAIISVAAVVWSWTSKKKAA